MADQIKAKHGTQKNGKKQRKDLSSINHEGEMNKKTTGPMARPDNYRPSSDDIV